MQPRDMSVADKVWDEAPFVNYVFPGRGILKSKTLTP